MWSQFSHFSASFVSNCSRFNQSFIKCKISKWLKAVRTATSARLSPQKVSFFCGELTFALIFRHLPGNDLKRHVSKFTAASRGFPCDTRLSCYYASFVCRIMRNNKSQIMRIAIHTQVSARSAITCMRCVRLLISTFEQRRPNTRCHAIAGRTARCRY